MRSKKGAAEWFWIVIGVIMALVVMVFLLGMFFDFGDDIRGSFDDAIGLTDLDAEELMNEGDETEDEGETFASPTGAAGASKLLLPEPAL
ncbi:hypothetical protein HOD83_00405 [Candidatus Woesearchaeota archaeon]|jgi:hypothetical protein|nr:hypothetical protein [Candidatus Woesearchaeota archaeon]MBT4248038.1 hypothetical protein [Candidatus Woesearchaeota archaeon]